MYSFACKCGAAVDVLRHHDAQTPPTDEEVLAEKLSVECDAAGDGEHAFEKKIRAPNVAFGRGWSATGGAGKGNWGRT